MPGKMASPRWSRAMRLSRSSCLTDRDRYPLLLSSPTVRACAMCEFLPPGESTPQATLRLARVAVNQVPPRRRYPPAADTMEVDVSTPGESDEGPARQRVHPRLSRHLQPHRHRGG